MDSEINRGVPQTVPDNFSLSNPVNSKEDFDEYFCRKFFVKFGIPLNVEFIGDDELFTMTHIILI